MKRALVGLGAACVLALCIVGIVLVVRAQTQARAMQRFTAAGPAHLAREKASARQEGIPLTAAELQKPLPPPSRKTAPLYVKLTKLLHDKPLGLPKYAEGMDAFHSYTPAQVAAVRRTLAARQDVIMLVHQAADRPQCVFVRDWAKGADLMFPEYQPMREAARLLKTESYLLARDGRFQEAVTDQARGFRVAEHAASDSVLIAYLVGIANDAITLSGMQSILALAGPNPAVDDAVQQIVQTRHSRFSLHDALAGETGFFCADFERMHKAEKNGIEAVIVAGGLSDTRASQVRLTPDQQKRLHDLIDAWEADYLARILPAVSVSQQPQAARHAIFATVDQQTEQDADSPGGITHLMTDIFMPTLSKMDQQDPRTRAREAITSAAAALLGERAKTGAYPAILPPGFVDPFTDKPLLYKREGTGFVVYSAGPTGHFDGGGPGQKVPGQESVFRYPSVPMPLV